MNKAFPKPYTIKIGTSDFEKMVTESTLFVDKTLLIEQVLKDGSEVTLITRPRRWGKTLNMTMMQYFFSIPVKEDGSIDEEERQKRYEIFSRLKIGQLSELLQNHLGKYPTIFVSFKSIKGLSYKDIENLMQGLIYKLYMTYEYLLQSQKLKESQKTLFKRFLTKDFDISELQNSLFYLSEMLFVHFNQKVLILIDEYDSPLNDWYAQKLTQESLISSQEDPYFQEMLNMFRNFLGSALKDNSYLEKGVITGILRVAKSNLFSGLNNLTEDSVLEGAYATHFGFTEEEINFLLKETNGEMPSSSADDMKSWYNGYNVGGVTIYNPWSIMNCLNNKGDLKAYWVGTASTTLLEQALILDKFQEDVQTLIEGRAVEMTADPKMVFADIKSSSNGLYNLLLFSGYLTPDKVTSNEGITYNCEVRIPNREILGIFETSTVQWVSHKLDLQVDTYTAFIRQLLEGNIDAFTQKLKNYLEISASFFTTGPKNTEIFYNGFILGLIASVSSRYFVETEKESGLGRADLMLIPKPTTKYQNALILEFKFARSEENLQALAQKALDQIDQKNYVSKIKDHKSITNIIKVGLAFRGKEVEVVFQLYAGMKRK